MRSSAMITALAAASKPTWPDEKGDEFRKLYLERIRGTMNELAEEYARFQDAVTHKPH